MLLPFGVLCVKSLSLGFHQAWELAWVIVEAGEHGLQIRYADVFRQNFSQHAAKIRGEREVAALIELMII